MEHQPIRVWVGFIVNDFTYNYFDFSYKDYRTDKKVSDWLDKVNKVKVDNEYYNLIHEAVAKRIHPQHFPNMPKF